LSKVEGHCEYRMLAKLSVFGCKQSAVDVGGGKWGGGGLLILSRELTIHKVLALQCVRKRKVIMVIEMAMEAVKGGPYRPA
jgi:hypothetical protein